MSHLQVYFFVILIGVTLFTMCKSQQTIKRYRHYNSPSRTTNGPYRMWHDETSQRPSRDIHSDESNTDNILNVYNITTEPAVKKWQVGRVSRKQYEIINMLWRRTNIFGDEEIMTRKPNFASTVNNVIKRADFTWGNSPRVYTTPNYIEFYYIDEAIHNKPYNSTVTKIENKDFLKTRYIDQIKYNSRLPLFSFLASNPEPPLRLNIYPNDQLIQTNIGKRFKNEISTQRTSTQNSTKMPSTSCSPNNTNSCKPTKHNATISPIKIGSALDYTKVHNDGQSFTLEAPGSSTAYDKIKFFELYDSNTEDLSDSDSTLNEEYNIYKEYNTNKDKRVRLLDIEHDMNPISDSEIAKHEKKHVKLNDTLVNKNDNNLTSNRLENATKATGYEKDSPKVLTTTLNTNNDKPVNILELRNLSRLANITQYPFAAVYIYERYQVHCDAAAISPHWLLAAGACLSRHNEDPTVEARSAYVAYCSENWWKPERVAYVKYSIIHPKFNPKDLRQRHLYNIGVIQVASSMASACTTWRPIPTLSHQFAPAVEGYPAVAVGWGLDRYHTSYIASQLVKKPLTAYEGQLFSNSCPGNTIYESAKMLVELKYFNNIYCLLLPPYVEESDDPVHGSILMVGGNLIGFFLQEERRRWGEQSAQYTGVWRLAPWINAVAKEPEEIDFHI